MRWLVVLVLVSLVACQSATDLYDPAETPALNLVLGPVSIPADGASAATLVVTVAPFDASGSRYVSVHASRGRFERAMDGATTVRVALDDHGVATERILAPTTAGLGTVSVQYGRVVMVDSIGFERALTDRIALDVDAFALESGPGAHVSLDARLARDLGQVTEQSTIVWSVSEGLRLRGSDLGP